MRSDYLSSRFSGIFGKRVRQRGQLLGRSVELIDGSANHVDAVVSGTWDYDVFLRVVRGELFLSCTCPYFETDGPCKHLWAVMREAERDGWLLSAATVARVHYVEDASETRALISGPPPPPAWKRQLDQLRGYFSSRDAGTVSGWPHERQIIYILEVAENTPSTHPVLRLAFRDIKKNGEWSVPKVFRLEPAEIDSLPDALDRRIVAALHGAPEYSAYSYYGQERVVAQLSVRPPLDFVVFPMIASTGRFYFVKGNSKRLQPLALDTGDPWRAALEISRNGNAWELTAHLHRRNERVPLSEPLLLTKGGWVLIGGRLYRLDHGDSFDTLSFFRRVPAIEVPVNQEQEFLSQLLPKPNLPELVIPEELRYEEVTISPKPVLHIESTETYGRQSRLVASVSFVYGGQTFSTTAETAAVYDPKRRLLTRRNSDAESALNDRLRSAGFKPLPAYLRYDKREWEITPKKLHAAVRALASEGWDVNLDGDPFRSAGEMRFSVTTGIDWFDLEATVDFGSSRAELPELLQALRHGDDVVQLKDGGFGLIPDEWGRKLRLLAATAQTGKGKVRFRHGQAALLDALLAAQPEVSVDETFDRIRREMSGFEGISEASQPEGFHGSLRAYQREGLAWLHFLRRFGLGGCLADDMGVGKTVQILALLEENRASRAGNGGPPSQPSLVVAPRSVVFNWIQEAHRFTPALRVLDYTGSSRSLDDVEKHDLVITTYGTLRRDILALQEVSFDCAILDEAQAIKNARTAAAKAARLLNAKQRLALTGTPVENHLGEIWSLFEFLNPGMLGASSLWKSSSSALRNPDPETRETLRRALRPYILRRTKSQVASELPEKFEQTIYCELDTKQRKLYNQLRGHYRDSILGRIEEKGLAQSKLHVLEALLRLRQAACHPGLIDSNRHAGPSAKLDALLPMLEETLAEGHKALVFSQFTSFLALLRPQLENWKWGTEYLDGKTRDRKSCVERFQSDPDCRLFLISLKAGGLGLNLTAADYVFLLDPWWNPAVEAQAIDRVHRIGQSRKVFAYRLVARDTVEEKVLELQRTKRELADAILSADNSIMRNLRQEDLEILLS